MTRVLYLLRYYPTLSETFVAAEIGALLAAGVEVTVARLGTRPDGALHDELPDVEVIDVPRRPLIGRLARASAGQRWLALHQRPKDAARLPWVRRLAAAYDRVHVHFAGEAAELARALFADTGMPFSVLVHAADLFQPRPSLPEVLADARPALAVARFHVDHLARMGISARLLRCGPDLGRWEDLPLPAGPLRVLTVARNVPKKGLPDLFAAWEAARPSLGEGARLVIVSDHPGPFPEGVEPRGLLPPSAVRAEMARANLGALACRRAPDGDMDGVPLALMEAMAAHRPVIGTAISGIPELVDEEVGWIVPPGDPDALGKALVAAADPSERARRGRAGPLRLRERAFTLEAQVAGLRAIWES